MRFTLLLIPTLTFFTYCNSPDTGKPAMKADSEIIYPSSSSICFDKNGERKRWVWHMKLGDSLEKIISFLDLKIRAVDSALQFESKKPIVKKGKHGVCEISVIASFDNNKLMKSFQAVWIYKGDKSDSSRDEFFDMILAYSIGCLWEETLKMHKERDTVRIYTGQIEQFTTELRNDIWVARYEAFMR